MKGFGHCLALLGVSTSTFFIQLDSPELYEGDSPSI
jgi:hypothetical protein